MPSMSFDLAPPDLPPPPSPFLRVLQLVLFVASIGTFGLATMRLVTPEVLDRTVQALMQ